MILVLALFAAMAIGSGSDSSESATPKNESSESAAAAEDKDTGAQTDGPAETPKPTATPKPTEEPKAEAYEVGEPQLVVYQNSIGSTWVQVAVPVKNTGGVNLFLGSGTIDLEDADGHLVDSMSLVSVYPQVLQPGETAWYYEETTLDEAPASELKAIPHVDVEKAKVDCIRYEVSDVTVSDEQYGDVKITGRVENTTSEGKSMVYISIFLYDADDKLLAHAFTILTDELKAGDKIGFSASTFAAPDSVTADSVARFEVYAYPTQFQF